MAKSTASSEKSGKRDRGGASPSGARRTTRRSLAPSKAARAAPVRRRRNSAPDEALEAAQPAVRQEAVTPTNHPARAPAAGDPSRAASSSTADGDRDSLEQPAPERSGVARMAAAADTVAVPPPAGVATAALALADAAERAPGGAWLEGAIRIQSEMLAFGWRQTERNLALGRAMLAAASLPEIIALQAAWVGDTFENTLRSGIALGRLAGDLLGPAPTARHA